MPEGQTFARTNKSAIDHPINIDIFAFGNQAIIGGDITGMDYLRLMDSNSEFKALADKLR